MAEGVGQVVTPNTRHVPAPDKHEDIIDDIQWTKAHFSYFKCLILRERASNLVPVLASVLHHPLQNLKEKSRNIFFSLKENGFLFPHINRFLKKKTIWVYWHYLLLREVLGVGGWVFLPNFWEMLGRTDIYQISVCVIQCQTFVLVIFSFWLIPINWKASLFLALYNYYDFFFF